MRIVDRADWTEAFGFVPYSLGRSVLHKTPSPTPLSSVWQKQSGRAGLHTTDFADPFGTVGGYSSDIP